MGSVLQWMYPFRKGRLMMKQKKIAVYKNVFPADSATLSSDVADFVKDSMIRLGVQRKLSAKAVLLSEETAAQFLSHAPEGSSLRVLVRRHFTDTSVFLSMPGNEYDPFIAEDDSEDYYRALLYRSFGENYKYENRSHTNQVKIQAGQSEQSMLYYTILGLVLGVLFGCFAKFLLPASVSGAIGTYALDPIKTIFLNALKIIIAPVVFFSIATSLSQYNNIRELGRLGLKTIGMYLLTTVFAVALGFLMFSIFHPGQFGFALTGEAQVAEVSVEAGMGTSVLDTIVNIVPSNFLKPFVESETLQLIFLAVVCGFAVGKIGEYSAAVRKAFDALNSLFLTITSIFTKLIPLAVFASVSLLIVNMSSDSLLSVMGHMGVLILTLTAMIGVYGLLVLGIGRLNPITFFRNCRESMLTSFTLCSSSAAMPTNMKTCTEKLGISPKVSNFTIPLGATINMDGTCIYLVVTCLFLARAYGVEVPVSSIFSLAVTIILLSLGVPGIPGIGLVCLATALVEINVPVESIGLVIAIESIVDMFITMSNTTGDIAATLIVAKSEHLLNEDVYNR